MYFNEKLKFAMDFLRLNATQMADKLGVDSSYIRHILRDPRRKLDHDKIMMLHKLTGFPLQFFLDENIKKPSEVAPTEELAKMLENELELMSIIGDEGLTKEEAIEVLKTVAKLKRRG